MKSIVPHPIPYQGSKRHLADRILTYFPDRVARLVEPFAGSAAISLAAAYYRQSTRFLLNDAHEPLATLWQEILHNPNQLAAKYKSLWNNQIGREREFYDQVRSQFNAKHEPHCFLYLLARCVKACIRYNSDGEFNNSPDNRRLGARPAEMSRRIVGAAELLGDRTEVKSHDYLAILAECDTDDVIYMDPPYQGVCGQRDNRYAPKVDHGQFCDALADLNKRCCRYIVSYDGRTGEKTYGKKLPKSLHLLHIELNAGRSTQATLLGRNDKTFESLYISPALVKQCRALDNSKLRQASLNLIWAEGDLRGEATSQAVSCST